MKTFARRPLADMPEMNRAQRRTRVLSFMFGLLTGSFVGALVMWLLAPRTGKRTRARLHHQYEEMREQMAEGFENAEEDVLEQAQRVATNVQGRAKTWQRRGRTMVHHK